jgi:pimeloyl-ACP methyl ester carboxylesterase
MNEVQPCPPSRPVAQEIETDPMLDRVHRPVAAVARAAVRPSTYTGQVRELTSTAVTAALWPLGAFGLAGVDRPLDAPATGSVGTPVLLAHGFGANKSNWLFVKRYLEQAGFGRVHTFDYNPLVADLPTLARRCAERADELRATYGTDRIHLVGHSLGGIVARYAVQVDGLDGVGVVATVCSPHGGNGFARIGNRFGMRRPTAGVQLSPSSPVMQALRSTARPLPTRFVAYYSNLDLIVPARRAMILEPQLAATNILVKDHGHLSIMLSRRLAASIATQLGAAEGLPGYGSPVSTLTPHAEGDAPVAPRGGVEAVARTLPEAVGE